jgi:glycosyltransferase involved in cell wall biosynthesis
MMRPFFSVITPSWNQGAFLGACIRSVLDQNDADFEHLIFDNCSGDETASVVAGHPHLRFASERDRGQSHAINKGFLAARGEVICWLNSDDAYPPGLFRRLREYFSDPGVEVVFGNAEQVGYDGTGRLMSEARFERRDDLIRWWSRAVRIHQPAVFFRRHVREAVGLLQEDLHFTMDYEYWWRMSERFRFHYRPEVLAIQHRQPESKTVMDWNRVYIEREGIFAPHYGLLGLGGRELRWERGTAMAERHLEEAFHAAGRSNRSALRSLLRSFREQPASFLNPRWLGVLPRLAGGRPTAGTRA